MPCAAHAKQLERKRLEEQLLAAGPTQSQLAVERRRLAKGVFKEEAIHGETIYQLLLLYLHGYRLRSVR